MSGADWWQQQQQLEQQQYDEAYPGFTGKPAPINAGIFYKGNSPCHLLQKTQAAETSKKYHPEHTSDDAIL
jgi:hypothetical protein